MPGIASDRMGRNRPANWREKAVHRGIGVTAGEASRGSRADDTAAIVKVCHDRELLSTIRLRCRALRLVTESPTEVVPFFGAQRFLRKGIKYL